jgi:hypothetical protein
MVFAALLEQAIKIVLNGFSFSYTLFKLQKILSYLFKKKKKKKNSNFQFFDISWGLLTT